MEQEGSPKTHTVYKVNTKKYGTIHQGQMLIWACFAATGLRLLAIVESTMNFIYQLFCKIWGHLDDKAPLEDLLANCLEIQNYVTSVKLWMLRYQKEKHTEKNLRRIPSENRVKYLWYQQCCRVFEIYLWIWSKCCCAGRSMWSNNIAEARISLCAPSPFHLATFRISRLFFTDEWNSVWLHLYPLSHDSCRSV